MPFPSSANQTDTIPNLLTQAERLIVMGKRADAEQLLKNLIDLNPREERIWLLLSEIQSDPEARYLALEKAQEINPNSLDIRQRLDALRPMRGNPLQRGLYLEENGELDQALQLYRSVIVHSPSATERVEANQRIEHIQLRQEADQIHPVSPTLNLLRVAFGPGLLFALMVFIQSGLNPIHISLLSIPGLVSVLAGSLMVSITGMRPIHPQWVRWFGVPGTGDEPGMRRDLRLLGWALMIAPFTIFLIEATYRLGVLKASMMTPP